MLAELRDGRVDGVVVPRCAAVPSRHVAASSGFTLMGESPGLLSAPAAAIRAVWTSATLPTLPSGLLARGLDGDVSFREYPRR